MNTLNPECPRRPQVVAPKVVPREEKKVSKWDNGEKYTEHCLLHALNDALKEFGLVLPEARVFGLPKFSNKDNEKPYYVGDKVRLLPGFEFPKHKLSKILNIKRDDPKFQI
jgi:hypothetical protein